MISKIVRSKKTVFSRTMCFWKFYAKNTMNFRIISKPSLSPMSAIKYSRNCRSFFEPSRLKISWIKKVKKQKFNQKRKKTGMKSVLEIEAAINRLKTETFNENAKKACIPGYKVTLTHLWRLMNWFINWLVVLFQRKWKLNIAEKAGPLRAKYRRKILAKLCYLK